MRIGALAQAAAVSVDAVRYYEREGLLDRPRRTPGGQRDYGPDALGRLRAVARAKALGFTLSETAALLDLGRAPDADAGAVRAAAARRLAETEAALAELARQRDALAALVGACDGAATARRECPILAGIWDGTGAAGNSGPGSRA